MQTEALRDRMVLLMNHMMLLRGETSREIDLSHMFSLEFTDEGVARCPVFFYDLEWKDKSGQSKAL